MPLKSRDKSEEEVTAAACSSSKRWRVKEDHKNQMFLNTEGINYSGSKNYELQDTRGPFKQM